MKKQREVRVKTYAVDGMSEAVYQIHYGRGHCLELRLSNGTKTQYGMKPAIYMSGNVIEQAIIENSELFKNGTVYVLRESEKGEKIEVEVRGKDDEAQTIGENGKAGGGGIPGDTGMPGRDGKPGGNGKTESSATKSPRTVAEGKARLAPDSASTGAEDTGTEGTSNESGEAEGTGNKSGEAEGTSNESGDAEGTGNKSGEAEGTGNKSGEAEGTGAEGDEAEGTGAEGDEAEGTGAEGGEAEGTGAEGDEAEGSESAGLVFEDLASAQDYLIERYGVKRTEIRSKKAVVELGKSRGVSVTIKD